MLPEKQQEGACRWEKTVMESNIYFRRLRLVEKQVKEVQETYISYEEMKAGGHFRRCPMKQLSLVHAIIELFYFIAAAIDVPPPTNIRLPKTSINFKRKSIQMKAPRAVGVCILLYPREEKKPKRNHVKDSIEWLMSNYVNLIYLWNSTGQREDDTSAELINDFSQKLKQLCEFTGGKLEKLKRTAFEDVVEHLEGTDLFRKRATLVQFAMYSILGLTKIDTSKTTRSEPVEGRLAQEPERPGEFTKYMTLLMHISLQQEFWERGGSIQFQKQPSNQAIDPSNTSAQRSWIGQNDQDKLVRTFVTNAMYKLKKHQTEIEVKRFTEIYLEQTRECRREERFGGKCFLQANIFTFLGQVMQFHQEDNRTQNQFWLFRRKVTLRPPNTGNSRLFKAEVIDYVLGYSLSKEIIEVVLITDILIKKENQEFMLRKVMQLKECLSFLDIANDTRKEGHEMRTYLTIRVYDKYPTEQPRRDRPPMILRMVQLMDEAAMILACIRNELSLQTIDDFYLNIDSKLPHETEHYLRLIQAASEVHYCKNQYSDALRQTIKRENTRFESSESENTALS